MSVVYVCRDCGSPELVYDAMAEWDVSKQDFSLISTYDSVCCNSDVCMGDETHPRALKLHLLPATLPLILMAQATEPRARSVAQKYVLHCQGLDP